MVLAQLLLSTEIFQKQNNFLSKMKKLYRTNNGVLGGICSGMSKYFNVDEVIIRLIFIILFFTSFPIVILYFIMWFIIPKEE